jgi:hypothetical protein
MKALKIMIAIMFIATISSCSSDDDNNNQTAETDSWNLVHVTGGFAGIDQTIPEGLIVWTFNEDTEMVEVVNNNTDEMINDFFDSGIYPYTIVSVLTNEILTIDNIELGVTSETPNELIIDHLVDDGFTLTFTK